MSSPGRRLVEWRTEMSRIPYSSDELIAQLDLRHMVVVSCEQDRVSRLRYVHPVVDVVEPTRRTSADDDALIKRLRTLAWSGYEGPHSAGGRPGRPSPP